MTTKELIDALQSIDEVGYKINLEGTVLIKDNKLWVEYINEDGKKVLEVEVEVEVNKRKKEKKMIIRVENNIINPNNIAILKREKNINTDSFISEFEYCISINGVKIKFSTEQERDKWFNIMERAMASE